MNEPRHCDSPTESPFIDHKQVDILEHSRVSDNCLLKSTLGPSPQFQMLPSLTSALDEYSEDSEPEKLLYNSTDGFASLLTLPNFVEQLSKCGMKIEQAAQLIGKISLQILYYAAIHSYGNFNLQEIAKINAFGLTEALESSIYRLALNMHGTRVVYKLIEAADEQGQVLIACEMQGRIRDLVFSQNGNHCVSRIFEHFEYKNIVFAITECIDAFMTISKHCYGCCIIQKCIARSADFYPKFFQLTVENSIEMVNDEYANFVYQCVFAYNAYMRQYGLNINELIRPLIPTICDISLQKASSHVAEKIVQFAGDSVFNEIQRQILRDRRTLIKMCCDHFGNYVIKQVLQREGNILIRDLREIKAELAGQQYAKFILNYISE